MRSKKKKFVKKVRKFQILKNSKVFKTKTIQDKTKKNQQSKNPTGGSSKVTNSLENKGVFEIKPRGANGMQIFKNNLKFFKYNKNKTTKVKTKQNQQKET